MAESTERPAFYALASGGWRDYWTLLHPPYTVWHLSYVVIGTTLVDRVNVRWLGETTAAFFLAVGVAAHALDELRGRPLRTSIPDRTLWALAAGGVAGAVALGIHGALVLGPWTGAFIVVGGFLVIAYNLELLGGRFHSDLWFALAWGGFPALTGFFAQTGTVTGAAVLVAAACVAFSAAQRVLSTPVRRLRRRVVRIEGSLQTGEGSSQPIDRRTLLAAPESGLRLLSLAMPLLAGGLLLARLI
ncbi:MAG TPA: hypothetical protein VE646_12555 [Actinomycetota bacterium]|jgi:hypothetical protein|nr:hypothetical protein [Actinomycetota bacterium]